VRLPAVTLVLGGARSGKSRYAETLVENAARSALYIATAQARDVEMAERIRRHRDRRGERWTTIEEPLHLASRLLLETRPERPILVDCLTLWLSNHLLADHNVEVEIEYLYAVLTGLAGPVVFVSNEVGQGIVPENATASAFRDLAGLLNQRMAARAGRVVLMAAGLPLMLKDES
jgi:adenosylcobinamide kinase/adenosylcobinamide-phosphate guanylyltransferase